ncbi:hypothetical protein M0805_007902 [Coniferiporia weirii]|nr:hypothetical protein M0805_007902 [Coniferiporia weirii]
MPEYVYALHDFAPEHEDEISFSAGDRIEVIEKDDMYGDGWWQGRNLFGKVGLFPQSYTTSDSSVLQPQPPSQVNGKDTADALPAAPVPTPDEKTEVTSVTSGGDKKAEEGGEPYGDRNEDGVMKATMTDVQEAIEQLGRNDRDGGGSFSFASTRDGDTTDRELDTDRETDSEAWHKGARSNLAEKARQQQELLRQEQAAYDAELQLHAPIITAHLSEPPIDFEMSDESEGEGEDEPDEPIHAPTADTLFPHRDHAHISEEEEDEENTVNSQANGHPIAPYTANHEPESEPEPSDSFVVPETDDAEVQPPITARQVSFPPKADIDAGMTTGAELATKKPQPGNSTSNTTQVQSLPQFLPAPLLTPTSPNSLAAAQQSSEKYATSASLPRAIFALDQDGMGLPHALPSPPTSQNGTLPSQSKAPTSPSDWSVEEVVEWARSKGFDNSVCDKFIEHEITGDVLLELDANILKTELEIHAFGKRTRIAKEIAELRRPPSILSSAPIVHSRTISQSISLPSSAHNSLSSPMATVMSSESPPQPGDITASPMDTLRRDSDPGSFLRASEPEQDHESATLNNSILGLGIGAATSVIGSSAVGSLEGFDLPKGKNRPTYLNLSPSDNSLNFRAKSAKFSPKLAVDESAREERAALSDSESTRALDSRSRRRRIFGRSTGSAHSDQKDTASRHSKEATHDAGTPVSASTSLPGTPSGKRGSADDASVKTHQRRKRSVDATKNSSDRLSLFGGSISISRSRKPPPRVQSYAHDDLAAEKHSRSLSRLYLGSGSRKASMKSQTGGDDGARRPGSEEKDILSLTNPSVLRKRTSSVADAPALPGLVGGLKAGQSVLEQIGTPDHNGWMRKKGEHYNTWKLRYFVLKGAHLYYLRSSDKLETKIKGYINIIGYKVIVDENVNPGKYGFRLIHETERTHFFSSDESMTVREWMKALMKATIGRDYTKPVISSCNIPTIPLSVAQTMNPAPRPPSPTQRDATQKALRRENPNQLSTRDARVLMGLPSTQNGSGLENGKARADDQFFTLESLPESQESMPATPSTANANISASVPISAQPPVRPSRETRRTSVPPVDGPNAPAELIQWANDYLPPNLRIPETGGQIYSGLALYRLAEAIKGKPTEPAVPDSAFPSAMNQDRLDGLFKLFDFFLDNDVRMGNVSINDVRQGRRDKIVHLLRSLKAWEEKRRAIARSIGRTAVQAGPFMALEPSSATSVRAW